MIFISKEAIYILPHDGSTNPSTLDDLVVLFAERFRDDSHLLAQRDHSWD